MEDAQAMVGAIALMLGAGWASGINLYAAILALGLMGNMGAVELPPGLEMVQEPVVLMAAGLMYFVEFFADKIPGVDSGWDALHTFIRIPGGAVLAAAAVGHVDPAFQVAAVLVGGGLAATSHATKAGSRVMINSSPEPFSNWTASVVEDVAVIGGIWVSLHNPWLFIALMALFILLAIWLLPKIWRGVKRMFRFIGRLFGNKQAGAEEN